MRRQTLALLLAACVAVLVAGTCTRVTAAAFTANTAVGPNSLTVDTLANYFSVTPGSATQPGGSTPVASGNVDALSLAFGTVPSARTFTSVFTIRNVSGQSQTATLTLSGVAQVASALFASSSSTTVTLAAGATTTLSVATSSLVAGHGSGTLRLGLSGSGWLYRDYPLSLDEAPEAPASITGSQHPAGRIDVSWPASTTTTNLAGYNLYRATGGAYVKLNVTPLAAATYSDIATVDGTSYSYKVRAVSSGAPTLESLDSSIVTVKADATPPAAPTAVAIGNGGGTGSVYVNLANHASVSIVVTLPAGSIATDTVSVTLGDGTRTVTGTIAAPAGAGSVTVAGLNTTTLTDGTLTITATSSDTAGNVSLAKAGTVSKDTVAPTAPTAAYSDRTSPTADRVTGAAETGATVHVTQTAPTASGPYTGTAAAGAYTVTVSNVRGLPTTVTFSVTATDAAGNTSSATGLTYSDTR